MGQKEGTLGICDPLEAETSGKKEGSMKEADLAEGFALQGCFRTTST